MSRAGIDETLVQLADIVRLFQVPHVRRIARGQAHVEQIGPGRAIGEQNGALRKKFRRASIGRLQVGLQIYRIVFKTDVLLLASKARY